jgi:hypothetical protein
MDAFGEKAVRVCADWSLREPIVLPCCFGAPFCSAFFESFDFGVMQGQGDI